MDSIIIGSITLGLASSIWFYYHIKKEKRKIIERDNQKKKELLDKEREAEKKLLEASQAVSEKEVYYQLNTDTVKLDLYPKSYFGNFNIARLYQKILIDNYWIEEPFYTEFSKLLQFIGANELWIKDPKSREIIINTRDNANKICKKVSMNILDLTEVLESLIYKVYSGLKAEHIFTKQDIQNSILSASIFLLSKSGEIDSICQILDISYSDEKELRYKLVNKICKNLSNRTKMITVETNFLTIHPIKTKKTT
jgi:hypothetical protein